MRLPKLRALPRPDYVFLGLLLGLLTLGLVVLSSAGSVVGFQRFGDTYFFLKRQLIFGVGLGGIAGIVVSRVRYDWWSGHAFRFLIVSVVLLVMVFLPGIGFGYNGAHRWISIGGFLFQPAEAVKLMFLLYVATLFARRHGRIDNFAEGNMPFFVVLAAIALLVILQPDVGTMSVIAAIGLSIYFVAGAPWKYIAGAFAAGVSALGLLIVFEPYRAARLATFLNPEQDPQGIGYHVNQALLAIGSGGLFGRGFGLSRQKFQYIPEVAGDSIFAVMAEELGFIFVLFFISLFLAFIYRGFQIARNSPDLFSKYVATGAMTWIAFQGMVNIAAMSSLLPLTGIPLPLVSYGSSSMVFTLMAMGIVLNISRYRKKNAA